ncbi:hypothetical protein LO762_29115 [Actinocorallia sp. API 0066]|uniref:hypothetical protein n=1 Tax=Actinocorallia sp. API 0066 TaxID=2896846 RepID=UPI001E285D13|nr:hypothetical protein [Actinocorallia sp. API 0066]MCD0453212.1 hypothetical protein [Actinocorallia sp. API 0066]
MKSLIPRGVDRASVGTWLLASLAVAWFSIVVIRVIPHDGPWPDYLTRWNRWDADRFWWLATYGYEGGPPGVYDPASWPAFFPGYPLAIHLVGFVVEDYRAAGLLISFLAGPCVALALSRLANHPRPPTDPHNAVPTEHNTPDNPRDPAYDPPQSNSADPSAAAPHSPPTAPPHGPGPGPTPAADLTAGPHNRPHDSPHDAGHEPTEDADLTGADHDRTYDSPYGGGAGSAADADLAGGARDHVYGSPYGSDDESAADADITDDPHNSVDAPPYGVGGGSPAGASLAGGARDRADGSPFGGGAESGGARRQSGLRGSGYGSLGGGRAEPGGTGGPWAVRAEAVGYRRRGEVSGRVGQAGSNGVGDVHGGSGGARVLVGGRPTGATAEVRVGRGPGRAEAAVKRVRGDGEWWRSPGFLAVLALVTSPCAVFLFAAYSEALFLALAVPAWLLAKKGRWDLAVLLAAGSSVVRITGLFLALGLVVEYLVGENGRRGSVGWRKAPLLVVPFVPIAAYMAYQWRRTGDMMAWQHAQEKGWNRHTVMPWEALKTTWYNAFEIQSEWTNAFRVEIFAAGVGVLLVAWLLYQRQWPETVYVATQLAAFMTSSFYLSIGRATLLWFPLWIALGHLMARHRWLLGVYLALSVPLMAAFVASFTQGQWTG